MREGAISLRASCSVQCQCGIKPTPAWPQRPKMKGWDVREDGSWEGSPEVQGWRAVPPAALGGLHKGGAWGGLEGSEVPLALCRKRNGTKGEKHISELRRGLRRATGGKVHPRS